MPAPAITIYTTPTCAFCHMAKEYFKSKNVEFEAKDVTRDAAAFKEFQDLEAGMGVPVINIGGTIIVGFDRPRIDVELREKGLV